MSNSEPDDGGKEERITVADEANLLPKKRTRVKTNRLVYTEPGKNGTICYP